MSAPTAASHTLPLRNCYWVVPGLLLAGEHPNGPTRDKTKDRLKKLLAAGIECFVDLTKPTELLRYDTFLPFYVEYTRNSIKDHGVPGARSQMTEILEHIANSMRAGRPVYVHCRAGIGRTGTVVGCLLAERGLQGNAVIDELNKLWQQCRRSKSWPFIPETDAQAKYVREWRPTLGSGFELSSLATAVATVGSMTADTGIRGRRASDSAPGAGQGAAGRAGDVAPGAGAAGRAGGAGRGQGAGAGAPMGRAGNGSAGGLSVGVGQAAGAAGRPAGGGLRAAAEQARAAVERGEVQVKAPPVPPASTAGPASTSPVRRGQAAEPSNAPESRRAQSDWSFDLQKGEISPSIRAEIADAIAGRVSSSTAGSATTSFLSPHGTAAPNDGEEAPWVETGAASSAEPAATSRWQPDIGEPRKETRGHLAADYHDEVARALGVTKPPQVGRAPVANRPGSVVRGADAGHAPAGGRTPAADHPDGAAWTADAGLSPLTARGPIAPHQPPRDEPADSDPLLDADTLAAARGLRERFVGTLFGLAVGDAVAATTQFRRPGTFTPIGDMLGGGPFDLPRGAWSDDTAMALCLAESLLERNGFDARDQVQRYSRWQQEGYLSSTDQCVGITANTARSLALAKWRRGLVFPGSHDPEQLDPEPLSRVASIALFHFASLETTLLQAVDSARITCQAPAVLDACRRLARALNAALSGQSKAKILADVGPITEAAAQSNNSAASALAAAFWAFSSTDNFRDAILRAANVGGNSDVVASVCGQLAGAHYGAAAIPQAWRNGLIHKDLIEGYADRLLAHALVSLSS